MNQSLYAKLHILEIWIVKGREENLHGGLILALLDPVLQHLADHLPPGCEGPELLILGL